MGSVGVKEQKMLCEQDLLRRLLEVVYRREGGGRTRIYRLAGGSDSSAFEIHLQNADEYICIVIEMSTQRLSDMRMHNDTKRLSDMKTT